MNRFTFASIISVLGFGGSALALKALMVLIMALLFQWLWNTTLPPLLQVPVVSYVQAAKLLGIVAVAQTVAQGGKI